MILVSQSFGFAGPHGIAAPADAALGHAAHPLPPGLLQLDAQRGDGFGKAGRRVRKAQEVLEHEDLAVAGRAGADADEREAGALQDRAGDFVGHCFYQEHDAPGLLERDGVVDDFFEFTHGATRGDVAARDRGLLRAAADVPAERNSGAGHDAQEMARICPTGMIFVPGEHEGISHNPRELSTETQCGNGVQVLLRVATELAEA